jgi:hypothetical protein
MSEHNNTSTTLLTKTGAIILIISILLSLLCIISGIVILVNENSGGGYGESGTSDKVSKVTAVIGSSRVVSSTANKNVELIITPSYSGYYYINLDDAYIVSLEKQSSGSSVSYDSEYAGYYDYSYSAYLSSGTTYVLTVRTTSSSFSYYIDR